ncbi:MAG: tRNA (guanosine(37)-N1)-methyltransferase TrmD [Desulfobacterales bacterium RIFOXYA12_FULL_46_15]|nr:MAG: tRNA (guanosine(37)-N1)-methyltransferase TrmD [Desulfobacterales bacterium RIFOXYA12_FULL_46_15]
MDFMVLSLFPELINAFFQNGMISRGIENNLITGHCINIRDFSTDRHNTVDDRPYGGGSGMVMKPEPLNAAVLCAKSRAPESKVILLTPQGNKFNQEKALQLAGLQQGLILICGRYEGIDERVYSLLVDEEISIGDYVMTGGELGAMVMIDTIARLIPGVLGSEESFRSDSFMDDRLEYAHYTRPEEFEGQKIPDILLSGNHEKIRQWRKKSSLQRTFLKRPDLFEKTVLNAEEKKIVRQWCRELETLARE